MIVADLLRQGSQWLEQMRTAQHSRKGVMAEVFGDPKIELSILLRLSESEARANLRKLQDRQSRGVLHGSWDQR